MANQESDRMPPQDGSNQRERDTGEDRVRGRENEEIGRTAADEDELEDTDELDDEEEEGNITRTS